MTIILVFALAVIAAAHQDTTPTTLVIRGGTIVDVRDYGASARDLRDAVVVVEHGKITAVDAAKAFAFAVAFHDDFISVLEEPALFARRQFDRFGPAPT